MAYVRKVRTASGAVAVQVVRKHRGQRTILAHVGSAHTDAQLGILLERARRMAAEDQGVLDIEVAARTQSVDGIADWRAGELIPAATRPKGAPAPPGRTTSTHSRLLYDVLGAVYDWLGFDVVDDAVFRDLVIARIVEPTSKVDAARVLTDLGTDTVSYRTIQRHLVKVNTGKYRDAIAGKCFAHAADRGGLSLLLYDVTTLYFEAENEDDLRKVGYSKERRIDPQIVVGLLVDRTGFPLEIGCFEGNTAETTTLVPIITAFADRHDLTDTPMVVAADAGMLSASNLTALDEAGLGFIVGSRSVKAPIDLASHFHWNGDVFTDGQIIDTVTPRHANTPSTTSLTEPNRCGTPTIIAGRGGRSGHTRPNGRGAIRKRSTPKRPAPARSSPANAPPRPPASSRTALGTASSTRPAWPARNHWSDSRATSPTSPPR